jgi:hypothetical protein
LFAALVFSVLHVQVTTFEIVSELKTDVAMKLRVWKALQDWESVTTAWSNTPFDQIAAEEIEAQVGSMLAHFPALVACFWCLACLPV